MLGITDIKQFRRWNGTCSCQLAIWLDKFMHSTYFRIVGLILLSSVMYVSVPLDMNLNAVPQQYMHLHFALVQHPQKNRPGTNS